MFGWLKVTFIKWCEEEKCEENEAIFMNTYLINYLANFFQFGMYGHVYRGHKIC